MWAVDVKAGVDEVGTTLNGDKRTSYSTGSPFLGVDGRPHENNKGREEAKGEEHAVRGGCRVEFVYASGCAGCGLVRTSCVLRSQLSIDRRISTDVPRERTVTLSPEPAISRSKLAR